MADYSNVSFKNDGKLKLLIIVGTRPEIIRLAAVINKTRKYFDVILAHTGQNYDYNLNGVFFHDLQLDDPEVYLNTYFDNQFMFVMFHYGIFPVIVWLCVYASILKNSKIYNEQNRIWMCDLERTNDKTELKYFYDQMRKMFDDFNQKYKSKYGSKLVKVYTVLEKAIEGLYNRTAYITQISKDYVCCFSEEKDLLSQWRGYGSDGNGIAIGFNAQLLRKLDINGSRYKFIKVIYDNEKVYENIRSYMEKQMITILDDIKEEELDPENILFNLVTVIAPMMEDNYIFKNPGFVEENEWRVYYKQIGNFDEDSGDEEILLKGAFSVENEFIYPFSRSELKFRSLKDDISSYFERND